MKLNYSFRIQLYVLLLLSTSFLSLGQAQQITFEGLKSVNGTALYCKVIGKGEPLVVLHGGPGLSHDYFLPHVLPLAKQYQLILFDQRAQGKSSIKLDSAQVSVQAMVDDIEGIREAFNLKKIHLIAHSWGGNIAIRYAAQHPESLKSLILLNVVPLNPQAFEEKMRSAPPKPQHPQDSLERAALMASEGFKKREVATFEKLMQLNFRRSAYDRTNMEALRLNLAPTFFESNRLLGYMGMEGMLYDLTKTAKKITTPTLIIHGSADLIPLESDLEMQKTIKHSTLETFLKSGHFPFVEEPKKFNRTIRGWIRQQSK